MSFPPCCESCYPFLHLVSISAVELVPANAVVISDSEATDAVLTSAGGVTIARQPGLVLRVSDVVDLVNGTLKNFSRDNVVVQTTRRPATKERLRDPPFP